MTTLLQEVKSHLKVVADQLRTACEEVGFFSIIGHGVPTELMDTTFEQVRAFHRISPEAKQAILMDRPEWPVGGMGYLACQKPQASCP